MVGFCDGVMTLIYGSNSIMNSFEDFENISGDVAVCDIDASFTNNIELPAIPDEQLIIRILNVTI